MLFSEMFLPMNNTNVFGVLRAAKDQPEPERPNSQSGKDWPLLCTGTEYQFFTFERKPLSCSHWY